MASKIQRMERQAHNFVFDVDQGCVLSDTEIRSQIRRIYLNKRTAFVDELLVVRGEAVTMHFKRKRSHSGLAENRFEDNASG